MYSYFSSILQRNSIISIIAENEQNYQFKNPPCRIFSYAQDGYIFTPQSDYICHSNPDKTACLPASEA